MAGYVYGKNVGGNYPNVAITIEEITPEIAAEMLKSNTMNRKMAQMRGIETAAAIRNGEFELNGATIVFAEDGTLLDGQHRLFACVAYNTAITSIVVRGISKSAQITMDTGKRRSVSDYLSMRGYANTHIVSSIGGAFLRAETLSMLSIIRFHNMDKAKLTVKEMADYIDANYETEIKGYVTPVRRVKERFRGLKASTLALLFREFKSCDIEAYEYFVGMLDGSIPPDKNMMVLFDAFNANARQVDNSKKLSQEFIAAFIIKTWNAYMRGEQLQKLRYAPGGARPEKFPEIFRGWQQ